MRQEVVAATQRREEGGGDTRGEDRQAVGRRIRGRGGSDGRGRDRGRDGGGGRIVSTEAPVSGVQGGDEEAKDERFALRSDTYDTSHT